MKKKRGRKREDESDAGRGDAKRPDEAGSAREQTRGARMTDLWLPSRFVYQLTNLLIVFAASLVQLGGKSGVEAEDSESFLVRDISPFFARFGKKIMRRFCRDVRVSVFVCVCISSCLCICTCV